MKLDSKSKLVRFAYWMDKPVFTGKYRVPSTGEIVTLEELCARDPHENGEHYFTNIPKRTSLCRFFWRAFVLVPLVSVPAAVILGVAWVATSVYGLIRSINVPVPDLGVGRWIDRTGDRANGIIDAVRESTFVAFFKAVKSRVCPIIEFENRG